MLKPTINRLTFLSILTLTSVGNVILSHQAIAQYTQSNYYQDYQGSENQQQYQNTSFTNYSQDITRYLVYVDTDNSQVLQRVKEIENTAYVRQYNGRRVIQSGVFILPSNAQQRVKELEVNGIPGAQILQFSTNQETPNYITKNNYSDSNYSNNSNVYQQTYYQPNYQQNYEQDDQQNNQQAYYQAPRKESKKGYYVVIPSNVKKMRSLGEEIVQKIGNNATVYLKNRPYGPHIAIGPFTDKSEAQLWNNYIHKIGYKNARLYYGK